MPTLYNWQTKQWEEVPVENMRSVLEAGTHTFEQGMDIPVISPDGEVGTVPGANIGSALKKGFILPDEKPELYKKIGNQQDVEAKRAIKKEHFDMPWTTAVTSAASGATFGLSDVAMAAAGAGEGLKEIREQSPTAHAVGLGAGMIGTALLGPGAAIVKGVGTGLKAGAGVLTKLAPTMVQSTARAIVKKLSIEAAKSATGRAASKIGHLAASSALEGAVYGSGEIVSEAALGDTPTVSEALSSLGTGLLFGAGAGGVLGAVQHAGIPAFQALFRIGSAPVKAALGKAKDVYAGTVTRGVAKHHGDDLAKTVKELLKDPDLTPAMKMYGTGTKALSEASELVNKKIPGQFTADIRESEHAIKNALAAEQKVIDAALSKGGDDLVVVHDQLAEAKKLANTKFASDIEKLQGIPPTGITQRANEVLGNALRQADDMIARRAGPAKEDALRYKEQLETLAGGIPAKSANHADEVIALRDTRQGSRFFTKDGELQKLVEKTYNDIGTIIKTETDDVAKASFQTADPFWHRHAVFMDKIADHAMTKGKLNLDKFMKRMKSPVHREEAMQLFNDIAEHAPGAKIAGNALEQVGEKSQKLIEMSNAFNRVFSNVKEHGLRLKNLAPGRKQEIAASLDDIMQIADDFKIKGTVDEKIGRAQRVLKAYENPDLTTMDKAMIFLREFGEDASDTWRQTQKYAKTLEKLKQVKSMGEGNLLASQGGNEFARTATNMAMMAGAVYNPAVAAGIGAAKAIGAVRGAGRQPINSITRLQNIEQAVIKTNNMFKSAVDGATKAILSTSKFMAPKLGARVEVSKNIEAMRKNYPKQREMVQELADPQNLEKTAERMSEAMSDVAPMVTLGTTQQAQKIASFLHARIPKDVLANQYLNPLKTGYKPSDQELAKWNRYLEAINDPYQTIKDIGNGNISAEGVEVLKNVYPIMFQNLKNDLMSAIMEQQPDLDYQKRIMLSQLFEMPTDPTLSGEFVQTMQSTYAQQNNGEQGGRPKTSKVDMETLTTPTSAQRIENK